MSEKIENNLLEIIEKNFPKDSKITIPFLRDQMELELSKEEDFGKRLKIVVNSIDNFFKTINGENILTYDELCVLEKRGKAKKYLKLSKRRKLYKI